MVATIGTIEERVAPVFVWRVDLIEGEFDAPCEICVSAPRRVSCGCGRRTWRRSRRWGRSAPSIATPSAPSTRAPPVPSTRR